MVEDNFRTVTVGNVTQDLLLHLRESDVDIGVKIAALRSCAAVLENAIQARTFAQLIENIIRPKT